MKPLILSMLAADRVGILASVTKALEDLKGELIEIGLATMQGHVTLMFIADFPDDLETGLIVEHCENSCRAYGVRIIAMEPAGPINGRRQTEGERFFVRINGPDRPGMLRWISTRTTASNIDVANISGHRYNTDKCELSLELLVSSRADAESFEFEAREWADSLGATLDCRHESEVYREVDAASAV